MRLATVMGLVHEEMGQHPGERFTRAGRHAGAAVEGDDAVVVGRLQPLAEGDQPLVAFVLPPGQLGGRSRWHITGPDVAHRRVAAQRGNVVMVNIEDVVQRQRQAGEEAGARRVEVGVRQLRHGRQQAAVGKAVGTRLDQKQLHAGDCARPALGWG